MLGFSTDSVALALLVACSSCASSPTLTPAQELLLGARQSGQGGRLEELWRARTLGASAGDFPIGPGDLLEVDVPDLPEMDERRVRVSAEGTIMLPLLGAVPVGGRTVEEVATRIQHRLEESVMHDPVVVVFVKEYRSRVIGVIGAVEKPGFYPLASETDTVLDAIALAGGMNQRAARRVFLIPSSAEASAPSVAALPTVEIRPEELRRLDPITVELDHLMQGGDLRQLNFPLRPGDVLVIPQRGSVLVKGWVQRPGAYEITPELTVLGAVTAAGGTRFAADSGKVRLIRQTETGDRVAFPFDLERIESGEQRDVLVGSGDVVDVSHSVPKAVGEGVYVFFKGIFQITFGRVI